MDEPFCPPAVEQRRGRKRQQRSHPTVQIRKCGEFGPGWCKERWLVVAQKERRPYTSPHLIETWWGWVEWRSWWTAGWCCWCSMEMCTRREKIENGVEHHIVNTASPCYRLLLTDTLVWVGSYGDGAVEIITWHFWFVFNNQSTVSSFRATATLQELYATLKGIAAKGFTLVPGKKGMILMTKYT